MKKEKAMKKFRTTAIILLLALQGWVYLHAQSTVTLEESDGLCALSTNCTNSTICMDIILSPGVTAQILSYSIWVHYNNVTNFHYSSDNSCTVVNGGDTNLDVLGHYRVGGASGSFPVVAGVPVRLHTICFTYTLLTDIDLDVMSVGGGVGSFGSAITYTMPNSNEPNMTEAFFTLNSGDISCLALPVKWLSFDANKKGETSVLDWRTGEEFNNKGFDVLRSRDGQNFEKIGWMDAKAHPEALNNYQFIDQHPFGGVNYYRLEQIDFDGKTDLSPIRTVVFNDHLFSVVVTPNPAKQFFYLDIQSAEDLSHVKLIDITGRVVLEDEVRSNGGQVPVNVDLLSTGTYTLVVTSGIDEYIERVVIMD
jgi:hypothetical protein